MAYTHGSFCTEDPFAYVGRAVRGYMVDFKGAPLQNDPDYTEKDDALEASVAGGLGGAFGPPVSTSSESEGSAPDIPLADYSFFA